MEVYLTVLLRNHELGSVTKNATHDMHDKKSLDECMDKVARGLLAHGEYIFLANASSQTFF